MPAHPGIGDVPVTPWDSVIRSLLFSGVGQIHNGQILKGVLLLPVSVSFCVLCLFLMMSFADVDRHGPFPYDRLFLYMAILGCIWLYAIIDAYIVATRMIRTRQQAQHN